MLCGLEPVSTRCTFWRLLGGEGCRLEGLTGGPRSPRSLEANGGVCLLASRPMRDPVGGVVDRATPVGQCRGGPRASVAQGAPSRARALTGTEGQERANDRPWLSLLGSLRLERVPEPRTEVAGVPGLDLHPWPEGTHEHTRGLTYPYVRILSMSMAGLHESPRHLLRTCDFGSISMFLSIL